MNENTSLRKFIIIQQLEYMSVEQLQLCLNADSSIESYYYIVHDNEEGKKPHFHCCISCKSPTKVRAIIKKYNLPIQQIENIKGSWVGALRYLIHIDNVDKVQYDVSQVVSNKNDYEEIINKPFKNTKREWLNDLLLDLYNGNVCFYDSEKLLSRCPSAIDYFNNINKFKDAYNQYTERLLEKDLNVYFVFGDSGSGKTTFAREWCKRNGLTYCVSSSPNDLLQDYKGQEVLILDDLRHYHIDFTDFLKLCDTKVRTSFKSRYMNKKFVGSYIFITTTEPLGDWYSSESLVEQRYQFIRRITGYFNINKMYNVKEQLYFDFDYFFRSDDIFVKLP